MMHYRIAKPPLMKTGGTVFAVGLIGLFVCVYLLFSGIHAHEQQLRQTEVELHKTQVELQVTRHERSILQNKVNVLENIEYERGTIVKP